MLDGTRQGALNGEVPAVCDNCTAARPVLRPASLNNYVLAIPVTSVSRSSAAEIELVPVKLSVTGSYGSPDIAVVAFLDRRPGSMKN